MHPNVHPLHRPSAMMLLFARYISGQIAEASWHRFVSAFDETDASPEEREALAEFFNDALRDFGPHAVSLPGAKDAQDFLAETRAA